MAQKHIEILEAIAGVIRQARAEGSISTPLLASFAFVEALEAGAAALGPEPWASIETAPKDGTRILGFSARSKAYRRPIRIVYWHRDGSWMADPCDPAKVTHWMPLPAPPDDSRVIEGQGSPP